MASTVTIKRTYTSNGSISIVNGVVKVDGQTVLSEKNKDDPTVIKIEGNIGTLVTDLDVVCNDVTGSVDAGGSVNCRNIIGNVDAGGSLTCSGNVTGNVDAGGSVSCGNVGGKVKASGSVSMR